MQLDLFQKKKFVLTQTGNGEYPHWWPTWEMSTAEAVEHVKEMWLLSESRYAVKLTPEKVMSLLQQPCFAYLSQHFKEIEKILKAGKNEQRRV